MGRDRGGLLQETNSRRSLRLAELAVRHPSERCVNELPNPRFIVATKDHLSLKEYLDLVLGTPR